MSKYSEDATAEDLHPNDVRPLVDETDHRILEVLAVEARIPNNALAERVGIAPSTCLTRVRALMEHGVIRGFYADIDPLAVGHALLGIGCEAQSPHLEIALDHGIETGLMDRHLARLEHGDLAFVDIDADHLVAGIGQARTRHQTHVAGAENRDSHA